MGLIDFSTPICVVHGRPFQVFRVCGIEIKACPTCTSPRVPMKEKRRFPSGPQRRSIARYAQRAKHEAAQSAWQGKSVAFIGKGSQKKIISRHRTDLPVSDGHGGFKYIRDTRTIIQQKYVRGTPWAYKLRKHDD